MASPYNLQTNKSGPSLASNHGTPLELSAPEEPNIPQLPRQQPPHAALSPTGCTETALSPTGRTQSSASYYSDSQLVLPLREVSGLEGNAQVQIPFSTADVQQC